MTYSLEQRKEILEKISDGLIEGKSLRQLKREDKNLPDIVTILKWISDDEENSTNIARARTLQAEGIYDKIKDITNRIEIGELDYNTGKTLIWSLQWQAGKMKPVKYGEASMLKLQGDKDNPLEMTSKISVEFIKPQNDTSIT